MINAISDSTCLKAKVNVGIEKYLPVTWDQCHTMVFMSQLLYISNQFFYGAEFKKSFDKNQVHFGFSYSITLFVNW